MKPDATSSKRSSTTTSRSARPPLAELPSDAAPSLSEAQYLHEQAASARAAVGEAFGDVMSSFKTGLKSAADPHRLTRDHPWLAVSTATVAGFAAALAFVPTKEEQALRKLAAIEAAIKRDVEKHDSAHANNENHTSDKKSSWLRTLAMEVFHAIRPVLTSLLTAGVQGFSAQNPGTVPPETRSRNQTADDPQYQSADIPSPS